MENNTLDYCNYHDACIDLHYIEDFLLVVMVNSRGETRIFGVDDNFFHPSDLVEAYRELWEDDWYSPQDYPIYSAGFKEWLIATTGTPAEDLEEGNI